MSYVYLGAAVQLLLILSALRVTAVQALQATQSKQTSDALRRARARRASTARGNFVDLVSARSSRFDVAASVAEEEDTVAPAVAQAGGGGRSPSYTSAVVGLSCNRSPTFVTLRLSKMASPVMASAFSGAAS